MDLNDIGAKTMTSYPSTPNGFVMAAFSAIAVFFSTHGHADAPPGRYMIANGTVVDTKTSLTWQQTIPTDLYSWTAANMYCAGLDLDGIGWRLPSVKELQTIIDDTNTNPAIDPTAFPNTPNVTFWTSSRLAGSPSNAWDVFFDYGNTGYADVAIPIRVRCVR
jgi:hypothetical protein